MLEIKHADESDLEYMHHALRKLNKLHHEAEPAYFKDPDEIENVKDLSKYLLSEDCFAYVVTESHDPIGFAVGEIRELVSPISNNLKIGSIEEIYIEEKYRGRGVGAKLNRVIERHCRDRGASELFTEVWGFNLAALEFYRGQGLKTHVHWLRKKL